MAKDTFKMTDKIEIRLIKKVKKEENIAKKRI